LGRVIGGDLLLRALRSADDHREQIVEIMRNRAGEFSQCVHLLRLLEFALGDFALCALFPERFVCSVEFHRARLHLEFQAFIRALEPFLGVLARFDHAVKRLGEEAKVAGGFRRGALTSPPVGNCAGDLDQMSHGAGDAARGENNHGKTGEDRSGGEHRHHPGDGGAAQPDIEMDEADRHERARNQPGYGEREVLSEGKGRGLRGFHKGGKS
jgi:hypothetical protein